MTFLEIYCFPKNCIGTKPLLIICSTEGTSQMALENDYCIDMTS